MFQLGHMTPVEATAVLEAATSMSPALGKWHSAFDNPYGYKRHRRRSRQ
jgi:hypothetical protein